MIDLGNSALSIEVGKILSNVKSASYSVEYGVILHTSSIDYKVDIVESIEIKSDYNSNVSDYVLLTCMIPAGDYVYDIHKERDNLQVTLIRKMNGKKHKKRYKLILVNNKKSIEGSRYTNTPKAELNSMEMIRIEGQCIDLIYERMRLERVDGIYRGLNIELLLRTKFGLTLDEIKGPGNYRIDIGKIVNDVVYDHIEVPTGIKLMDLPSYLQETHYGVYNGNIGTYLTSSLLDRTMSVDRTTNEYKDTIFIYPLYSTKRFDTVKKKMIIYSIPDAKYENVEHTYRMDGDILKIVTGNSGVGFNTGTDELVDKGTAITVTKADDVMMRNNDTDDDEVNVSSDLLNVGEYDTKLKDNTINQVHIGPESNMYKYRSDMIKHKMMYYQVQWNYCDVDLLYPGMPLMYIYNDGNKLIKLKGTLQSIYVHYNMGTNTANCLLNLAVIKPELKG